MEESMSLVINTNIAALNAYQNLSNNQNMQNDAIQKLSSGLRINKAADDAAGLSISQGLTSQINGLTQAVSNTQDATDVAQIADGALGTTQQILQRMRTLVVQAGNSGTQDDSSLSAIQQEMTSLNAQLNNISSQTKYGQKSLLDGTYSGNFQVGANGGDVINLNLSGMSTQASALGVSGGTKLTGLAIATGAFSGGGTATYTSANASADLAAIDAAITNVSTARSTIGATQNQLTYTASNLQTAITNVTASRSNLTDADLAKEVTSMTQAQILTQAATSVLSQANSAPQAILKLLQ
jgi:flagellin